MFKIKPGMRVALTGGIACGKTEAAAILARLGAAVWEADTAAHRLMRRGTPVYDAVARRFGPSILAADGEIDRHALGARVFDNDDERAALNSLVHPAVIAEMQAWRAAVARNRTAVAVVPLLYEAGLERDGWDAVLCVAADGETVRRRLAERGLAAGEIERRLAAQWPLAEKIRRADAVFWNNGTKEDLEREIKNIWSTI